MMYKYICIVLILLYDNNYIYMSFFQLIINVYYNYNFDIIW